MLETERRAPHTSIGSAKREKNEGLLLMQLFTADSALFEVSFQLMEKKKIFNEFSFLVFLFLFSVKSRNLLRYPVLYKKK